MSKFVITTRENGEFQFVLKAKNGQTILVSEGYTTKQNCRKGINSVLENVNKDAYFERKISVNSKFYFNLKARNGKIIGTSEMYECTTGRENGILSVKTNAPVATINDKTYWRS